MWSQWTQLRCGIVSIHNTYTTSPYKSTSSTPQTKSLDQCWDNSLQVDKNLEAQATSNPLGLYHSVQYKPEPSSRLSQRIHLPSLPFSSPCLYLCVCLCVSLSCHLCVWFSPCLCVSFPRNLCAHCKIKKYVGRGEHQEI